jgi:hypothetical protein
VDLFIVMVLKGKLRLIMKIIIVKGLLVFSSRKSQLKATVKTFNKACLKNSSKSHEST